MNTDLFSTKKHMVFLKTLLKMLKKGSIFQVMNWQDCYQKKKNVIGLMKDKNFYRIFVGNRNE